MKTKNLILSTLIAVSITSCKQKEEKTTATEVKPEVIEKTGPHLDLVWETDSIFKTPESCFFDKKHDLIYVSNVNNAPRTKDNNGFISTLSVDGKILNRDWTTGLSAPKGMGLYRDILYVTDIDAIVEIDAHTGKILKRSTLKGALMLNDISIDDETGIVYVSAMDTGKIYSYDEGEFELWKEGFNRPNGLLVDGDCLLLASAGDNNLKAFDLKTKEQKEAIASNLGSADGIVKLHSGSYVVSDWRGEIHLIDNESETKSLLNTIEDKKAQTADIGSIPDKNIILVPTFFGNKVKAFKITE